MRCLERPFWLFLVELYNLHLYIRKLVLLEATKENASELHRSASALNSKDNNGIGNIYHTLSCSFFVQNTLSAFKKFCVPLSFIHSWPCESSVSFASYRKSGSMSNGWNCQYRWNPLKACSLEKQRASQSIDKWGAEIRNTGKVRIEQKTC